MNKQNPKGLLLDLDGTLYPSTHGLERRIVPAVQELAAEMLNLPVDEALPTLHRWSRMHGHVALGVQAELGVDPVRFIDEVYERISVVDIVDDVDISGALSAVADKRRVVLLTNSPRSHALRMLAQLSIPHDVFADIVAIEDFGFALKPDPRPFKIVVSKTSLSPNRWTYFDDSIRNIHAAWKLGFSCCLVSNKVAPPPLFWENHFQVMHLAPQHIPHTFDLPQSIRSLSV